MKYNILIIRMMNKRIKYIQTTLFTRCDVARSSTTVVNLRV